MTTPNSAAPLALHYAGFWRRLVAGMLDLLLLITLTAPPLYLIYGHDYFFWAVHYIDVFTAYGVWDVLLTKVLALLAILYCWTHGGATPGKLLMHCIVVDATTLQPLRYRRAALRLAAYVVSALPFYLGFFWIGWDKRKQGLHDRIANTVVLVRPADYSTRTLEQLMEATR